MSSTVYIPSQPAEKNIIQLIWQVDHKTVFQKERIIPRGIVEVIFNFSGSNTIHVEIGNSSCNLPDCFINGFNTSSIDLVLPKNQVFFGVQLQPLAVGKLFGMPAGEFANLTVDLTLISPAFRSLWQQLAEQAGFNERVNVFLDWATQKHPDWLPQELFINTFLHASNQHGLSVSGLAGTVCYSPRHLSRKIIEATGMNTEEILLYKKYLHAVELMHYTPLTLTEIAYQSHFADQSHFIRTFKAYTDMTPGAYRRNKGERAGHLFENVC
jgi:AraC-like DNA-binding protein